MKRGSANLPAPFAYPSKPHVRQHGPQGYSAYRHYRNWLRDEFAFRCVYCLRRETWLMMRRDYEIDHFLPKSEHPDVERDYDNLVFACRACNGTKAAKYLPSPESVAYGDCLSVDDGGEIHARNEQGEILIEALRLDAPEYNQLRRRILLLVSKIQSDPEMMRLWLGYPDELPNLAAEKPPKGNKRPQGIYQSHHARKQRGELTEYY